MSSRTTEASTLLAKPVAAEDLRRGDYVAILSQVHEFPSFFWCCDASIVCPEDPVRVRWQSPDNGLPLKVSGLCLPFVLVRPPSGRHRTIDVRRCQLVRLDRRYAKRVNRAMGNGRSRKKRRT